MENNIITKEDFIKIMGEIHRVYRYNEKLNAFFRENNVDGYIFQPDCIDTALKLLHLIFGKKDADDWINYFCFDLDFGRGCENGYVIDENGNSIPLATIEDLYNLLTE